MTTPVAVVLLTLVFQSAAGAQQEGGSLARCARAAMDRQAGSFVKVEVETSGTSTEQGQPGPGISLLELEIRAADGSEWELTCDEKSGRIIEVEREVKDASDPLFKTKARITEEQARATVLAAHPGEIVEVEYEIEASGAATYEFDVKQQTGPGELKVEVDATTGKIVELRREDHQIGSEPSAEADD